MKAVIFQAKRFALGGSLHEEMKTYSAFKTEEADGAFLSQAFLKRWEVLCFCVFGKHLA